MQPWLLLSLTATSALIGAGGSADLLADVANLSAGGIADGPFFASGQALFASTPAGTHTPPAAPLDADLRAGSAFAAGAQAPSELRATVDNQTVRILNSSPPAPEVIPDIRPDDGTLTPGEKVEIIVEVINRGNRTARRVTACTRLSAKLRLSGKACRIIRSLPPGHTRVLVLTAIARRNACGPARLPAAGQSGRPAGAGAPSRRTAPRRAVLHPALPGGRDAAGRDGDEPNAPRSPAAGPDRMLSGD